MRIKWRGLELPNRVTSDRETLTDTYGRFAVGTHGAPFPEPAIGVAFAPTVSVRSGARSKSSKSIVAPMPVSERT